MIHPLPRQPAVFGFTSGAGASVTQATSKATAVTINALTGKITTDNAALGSGGRVTFTVNNSMVEAGDVVVICHATGVTSGAYLVTCVAVAAGSFDVLLQNLTGGSLSQALGLNFVVIKGASA